MASHRLARQQEALLKRIGTTVVFQPFVATAGNVNQLTHEVLDTEAAYPRSIAIAALINYSPSIAQRQQLGLEEDVDAVLTLLVKECQDRNITITTADRFLIGESSQVMYVTKVAPRQQSGTVYLTFEVAVNRQSGGQRNR